MTREEVRQMVKETIKQYAEELFTLFFRRMLTGMIAPETSSGGCSGGGCKDGGGCCKTQTKTKPQTSDLLLEEDITALYNQGQTALQISEGTIITPLAVDKARDLGIELIRG